jgi:hypothetical protein
MKKGELRCCLGCGRDCRGEYCQQCTGDSRCSKEPANESVDDMIHEDRYDEESGPDDTWDAQPPMFGKSEKGR